MSGNGNGNRPVSFNDSPIWFDSAAWGQAEDCDRTLPSCNITYAMAFHSGIARIGQTHNWRRRLKEHIEDYGPLDWEYGWDWKRQDYNYAERKYPLIGLTTSQTEAEVQREFSSTRLEGEQFKVTDRLEHWIGCHRLVKLRRPWPIVKSEWAEWNERALLAEVANSQYCRLTATLFALTRTAGSADAHELTSDWPPESERWARPESMLRELEQLHYAFESLWGMAEHMRDREPADESWYPPWECLEIVGRAEKRFMMWYRRAWGEKGCPKGPLWLERPAEEV